MAKPHRGRVRIPLVFVDKVRGDRRKLPPSAKVFRIATGLVLFAKYRRAGLDLEIGKYVRHKAVVRNALKPEPVVLSDRDVAQHLRDTDLHVKREEEQRIEDLLDARDAVKRRDIESKRAQIAIRSREARKFDKWRAWIQEFCAHGNVSLCVLEFLLLHAQKCHVAAIPVFP